MPGTAPVPAPVSGTVPGTVPITVLEPKTVPITAPVSGTRTVPEMTQAAAPATVPVPKRYPLPSVRATFQVILEVFVQPPASTGTAIAALDRSAVDALDVQVGAPRVIPKPKPWSKKVCDGYRVTARRMLRPGGHLIGLGSSLGGLCTSPPKTDFGGKVPDTLEPDETCHGLGMERLYYYTTVLL